MPIEVMTNRPDLLEQDSHTHNRITISLRQQERGDASF